MTPSLDQQLRATGDAVLSSLGLERSPALGFPPALERAIDAARWDAIERGDEQRLDALERHYLDAMPRLLLHAALGVDPAAATVMHRPLDWAAIPRLRTALTHVWTAVERAGANPGSRLPTATADAWFREGRSLAETYADTQFAGCMPLLGAYPHELVRLAARVDAGEAHARVVELGLGAHLLHELWHLDASRPPFPVPFLDECLVAALSSRSWPWLAWRRADEPEAIMGSWCFVQVADALIWAHGLAPVVRAHVAPDARSPSDDLAWRRLLGDRTVDVLACAGWDSLTEHPSVHLMGDISRPLAWARMVFGLATLGDEAPVTLDQAAALDVHDLSTLRRHPGCDLDPRDLLRRALWTVSLHERQTPSGSWQTTLEPPPCDVVLDWRRCEARLHRPCARSSGDLGSPRHWLPPDLCAAHVGAGRSSTTLDVGENWVSRIDGLATRWANAADLAPS